MLLERPVYTNKPRIICVVVGTNLFCFVFSWKERIANDVVKTLIYYPHFHYRITHTLSINSLLQIKMSTNQNEKVSSWNGNSDDGLLLKMLVERHLIENMKPSEIKAKYPQFRKYTPNCFCSAMKSVRHSYHNKQAKKISMSNNEFRKYCVIFF